MNGTTNPRDFAWENHVGGDLAQGDFLPACLVPAMQPDFDNDVRVPIGLANLIVLTQTCDLVNGKADFVALCPVFRLPELVEASPQFAKREAWEEVRKGRREGFHMLPSTERPDDNQLVLVVDFRQIFSLPFAYLSRHGEQIGSRLRLRSPYLEHFSQAFARFFMRVGLPSTIPPYR